MEFFRFIGFLILIIITGGLIFAGMAGQLSRYSFRVDTIFQIVLVFLAWFCCQFTLVALNGNNIMSFEAIQHASAFELPMYVVALMATAVFWFIGYVVDGIGY